MVLCSKSASSPGRPDVSRYRPSSPVPVCRAPIYLSSISQFLDLLDHEQIASGQSSSEVLRAIPEREWRLLAALAKKRERDDEQKQLADQFRRLWQKETEERMMIEAETSDKYRSYIISKRDQERMRNEYRRIERDLSEKEKAEQLAEYIRYKERKSAGLLACHDERKATHLVTSALVCDARARLAAARRLRSCAAERRRREAELLQQQRRVDSARERRGARLRDDAKRVAINNALSDWECCLLRQEQEAMVTARRAAAAARAADTAARSAQIKRNKEQHQKRARKIADVTQQMREAVRGYS